MARGAWAAALGCMLAVPGAALAQDARPQTIPALRSWTASDGTWALGADARIVVRHANRRTLRVAARQLAGDLGTRRGRRIPTPARRGARARPGDVLLARTRRDPELGPEGYGLRIGRVFTITAPRPAGVFYGGRTLLQLLRGADPIRRGRARDRPRYPERGLMVDAGRKYYTYAWLAARVRELARLKLNLLHLHLSDHQGFRIQSDTHPEIVSPQHLTQQEVRDLLALARRHHEMVVPEIDMPGHMPAALAGHPELQLRSVTGQAEPGVLDVGNPAARRFALDLVGEYLDLFDGPYWHVGADEVVPFVTYPLGLYPSLEASARGRFGPSANAKDAVHGFVNDVDALVRSRGRTTRMWHDDVGGGSAVARDPRIVTEWWIDVSPLSDVRPPAPADLLARGHRILNAGWFPTYHVNGVGGSPIPVRPNLRTAYESWDVHEFHGVLEVPAASVAPGEPRNLGAKVHLWNDNPAFSTEQQDAVTIRPGLRVIAQKTWGSPLLTPSYAAFTALAQRLGS